MLIVLEALPTTTAQGFATALCAGATSCGRDQRVISETQFPLHSAMGFGTRMECAAMVSYSAHLDLIELLC